MGNAREMLVAAELTLARKPGWVMTLLRNRAMDDQLPRYCRINGREKSSSAPS